MSETCALLGRVYKDRWDETRGAAWLDKAIHAYLAGFEADPRDAYPGVNAVTLMELRDPPDDYRKKILPVVRFAVERKIAQGHPDYWDYATLLELAILAEDQPEAEKMLDSARPPSASLGSLKPPPAICASSAKPAAAAAIPFPAPTRSNAPCSPLLAPIG